MRRIDKITIAVTLVIICCLVFIPGDKTQPLAIIGMVFVVGLPGYIYYRKRKSEKDSSLAVDRQR